MAYRSWEVIRHKKPALITKYGHYALAPVGGATQAEADQAAKDLNNCDSRPYASHTEWLQVCRALGLDASQMPLPTCGEVLVAIDRLKLKTHA